MSGAPRTSWEIFLDEAGAIGLNLCYVVRSNVVNPAFAKRHQALLQTTKIIPPEHHLPNYRTAILLGSGGTNLWEAFQAGPEATDGRPDPLDRFIAKQIEALADRLRGQDPHAVTAFPFHHPRQIIPFLALVEHTGLGQPGPFGLTVHPTYGPWFAWRGVVLSQTDWPDTPMPEKSPCEDCLTELGAPCTMACPTGAATSQGLDWPTCLKERQRDTPCQRSCAARVGCIVGQEHRYGPLQTAHHAAASYREIKKLDL